MTDTQQTDKINALAGFLYLAWTNHQLVQAFDTVWLMIDRDPELLVAVNDELNRRLPAHYLVPVGMTDCNKEWVRKFIQARTIRITTT